MADDDGEEVSVDNEAGSKTANGFNENTEPTKTAAVIVQQIMTPSASVTSFSSSVLEQMKLDDDDELMLIDSSKDLLVRVDNPEKHTSAVDAYVTFRVLTKTTRSEYDSHEYCVRRRYNDFIWLRSKLEDTFPTHIIPPLPEKHSFQRLSRFNVEFLKARMSALNKFLIRLSEHPVLSYDKDFQLFLTSKPFEFTAHRREGRSLMGRVSNAFQSVATGYMMKKRTPEFDKIVDYVHQFEERLSNVERITQRINKEREEFVAELQEFHPVFTLWSSSEGQLNGALLAISAAVEKCSRAQLNVTEKFADCGRIIREYVLYADAMRAALNRRDALQIEYELTVDDLNSRKQERDQSGFKLEDSNQQYSIGALIGRSAEDVKKDKQDRVDIIIESLMRQVEANNEKLECGDANLRSDVERWHEVKNADLKRTFTAMADRQIELYQTCLAAWEEAIQLIRDTGFPNDLSASNDNHFST